ncbi:hypothetical protein EV279_3378 [Microbacterium sp. BK668]|nr:hypothetical protein EV279_3378 [Microbacterium sp. BK668]
MYQAVADIQPVAFRLVLGTWIGKARPAAGDPRH